MDRYTQNPSYWEFQSFLAHTDYAIVGAGMTGLITAIKLKERKPKANVLILERSFLPSGASTKNAGFACFGSLSELIADLEDAGMDQVLELATKRYKGLLALRKMTEAYDIDWQQNGGYEVFPERDKASYESCLEKLDLFNDSLERTLGVKDVFSKNNEARSLGLKDMPYLLFNKAEGQLNPGKLMKTLLRMAQSKGIKIFNGLAVEEFESHGKISVRLENSWTFNTNYLIFTNNAFAKKMLPSLDITPVRNPVFLTSRIPDLQLKGCFHYQEGYIYFRNVDQRVLIGGARHLDKVGETTSLFGINPLLERHLRNILDNHVLYGKEYEIEYKWSGILAVGSSKKPIVKHIKDNIFVAARMGGMGLAISSLVAEEALQLLTQ